MAPLVMPAASKPESKPPIPVKRDRNFMFFPLLIVTYQTVKTPSSTALPNVLAMISHCSGQSKGVVCIL